MLYGLAKRFPSVRFAAIATSWCSRETQFFLSQHHNIDVFPATPDAGCDAIVFNVTSI